MPPKERKILKAKKKRTHTSGFKPTNNNNDTNNTNPMRTELKERELLEKIKVEFLFIAFRAPLI